MEEKLTDIDYLMLAAIYHRDRVRDNTELVKHLMKTGMKMHYPKLGEQRPFYYEHPR